MIKNKLKSKKIKLSAFIIANIVLAICILLQVIGSYLFVTFSLFCLFFWLLIPGNVADEELLFTKKLCKAIIITYLIEIPVWFCIFIFCYFMFALAYLN